GGILRWERGPPRRRRHADRRQPLAVEDPQVRRTITDHGRYVVAIPGRYAGRPHIRGLGDVTVGIDNQLGHRSAPSSTPLCSPSSSLAAWLSLHGRSIP